MLRIALVSLLLGLAVAGAGAEPADSGGNAAQAVALFAQACVRFVGAPAAMRAWISSYHLQQIPAALGTPYLHGRTGEIFAAPSVAGNLALVSFDDGGCAVLAEHADTLALDQHLQDMLRESGAAVTVLAAGSGRQDTSHRLLLRATLGTRSLRISAVSQAVSRDPAAPPEALLSADPG